MNRLLRRVLLLSPVAAALVVLVPGTASAHPLGNFTVNRYSGIVVTTDAVTVDHVRDLAEIPTAQRRPTIDTSGDDRLSRSELAAWARAECRSAGDDLRVEVDGRPAPLSVRSATARTSKGQAGLPVLRLECSLRAPVSLSGPTSVALVDAAGEREVGWKEVTAVGDGVTLTASDVPERTSSRRLTSYPQDLLSSPLDVTGARLEARPGGPRLQPAATDGSAGSGAAVGTTAALTRGADRLTLAFESLVPGSDQGPLAATVALLGAIVLGAAHAVAPGHGKTVMAFFLSGRRDGALRSAATVGATVTVTHTAGVLLLGLIVSAGTAFAPARLYPWLGLVSGLLVLLVGLSLLRSARHPHTHAHGPDGSHIHPGDSHGHPHDGSPGHPHEHDHSHDHSAGHSAANGHEHPHPHGHGHDHEHPHPVAPSHGRAGVATLERTGTVPTALVRSDHGDPAQDPPRQDAEPAPSSHRSLIAMGLAGGLVPSPSALIVFLGATGLGHPWFGVALVVAFGVGMATTLAAVGLLVMRLRERAESRLRARPSSRLAPLLRLAPLVTASAVVVLGTVVALRGLSGTGLL